jgi:hypothetical protein
VPDVILIEPNASLACKKMEGRDPKIADSSPPWSTGCELIESGP